MTPPSTTSADVHTHAANVAPLTLAHGVRFDALYTREGLLRVDALFLDHLRGTDPELAAKLGQARQDFDLLTKLEESALLIGLAPHLEDFIAGLFGMSAICRRFRFLPSWFAALARLTTRVHPK